MSNQVPGKLDGEFGIIISLIASVGMVILTAAGCWLLAVEYLPRSYESSHIREFHCHSEEEEVWGTRVSCNTRIFALQETEDYQ